jgi:methylmalonyl-CoA epimerase
MILGIDHVGIAVVDADAAAGTFRTLLGLDATEAESLGAQQVRVCFVPVGAPNLELLSPLERGTAVDRFIQKRGEGMHHVCFAVDDLRQELARLREAGFNPIDEEPRRGHGGLVAFLHPRSAHGVLVELLQRDG